MTTNTSRNVLITGVSQGLGRAMVAEFARRGHHVTGCARNSGALADLRREFPEPAHRFEQVDVSDDTQVARWAADVLAARRTPDLLLNNAAIINRNSPLWRVPPDEFSRVVDINVKGVFHVLRHFVPAMVAAKSGVIVNFSSTWGRTTSPEVAPYCATKWAIEGLTSALASELPHGIAAIPLNPGVIATEMLRSCFGSLASAYPTPEQWAAKAVPFLLELSEADSGDPLTAPN